jgi:ribonuclease VapC
LGVGLIPVGGRAGAAEEVAGLTGESKTEAIRIALRERRTRLRLAHADRHRSGHRTRFLETEIWSRIPAEQLGWTSGADPGDRRGGGVILDSSAILELRGPQLEVLERESAPGGTPTLAETGIVLHARVGEASRGMLERFLDEFGVQEIPFGEIHWREAVEAFRRFGRGRHPAALNFGDCLTYATTRLAGESLLFTGGDFGQTDLSPPV